MGCEGPEQGFEFVRQQAGRRSTRRPFSPHCPKGTVVFLVEVEEALFALLPVGLQALERSPTIDSFIYELASRPRHARHKVGHSPLEILE